MKKLSVLILIALFLNACSASYGTLSPPQPSENPPASTVRRLLTKGELSAEAYQQDEVGSMSPVYIVLRNETSSAKIISLKSLMAVNSTGARVLAVPAEEAARQAGEARAAPGMWKGAATGAGVGAAIGTVAGSIIGLVLGGSYGAARGALIGGAAIGGTGALAGADYGHQSGALNAQAQVLNTHLRDQVLDPGSQAAGYAFFPKDNYGDIRLIVTSSEERQEEIIIPIQRSVLK